MLPVESTVTLLTSFVSVVEEHVLNVPVAAFSPKTYNAMLTITVMNIKGINTMTHAITLSPL
jgi:hypothetical protein